MENLNIDFAFELKFIKNSILASGIGSSATSAVSSVSRMNELLRKLLPHRELSKFAIKA